MKRRERFWVPPKNVQLPPSVFAIKHDLESDSRPSEILITLFVRGNGSAGKITDAANP